MFIASGFFASFTVSFVAASYLEGSSFQHIMQHARMVEGPGLLGIINQQHRHEHNQSRDWRCEGWAEATA